MFFFLNFAFTDDDLRNKSKALKLRKNVFILHCFTIYSIEKMKSSSADYDNIPISVFKHTFDIVVPAVTEICNRSLTSGMFPNCLEIAKMKCFFKKGS